jgi:hypothetical protein
MSIALTREQASRLGGLTAGVSLGVALLGALLVEPIVIGVGAVGVAAAAFVKLSANEKSPTYTPSNHPMRRAEDQKREAEDRKHERVGA